MKEKIKSLLLLFLLTIFIAVILALTIRGVPGNPSPREILTDLRSEGKPFELSPERGRYALVMSIVENNSLSFTREIAEFVLPDLGYRDGKFVSVFAPGVSFLALPLYVLGRSFNMAQVFTFSTSSVFALLNVLLILAIVNRLTKSKFVSVASGLTFLFATTAWPYSATLYQHHTTTFLLLAALYTLTFKTNFASSIIMGILFGISIFVEYPNAIFFIPFLILLISRHISSKEMGKKLLITIKPVIFLSLLGFAISLAPSLWYIYHAYGDLFRLAGTVQGVRELRVDSETNEILPPPKPAKKKSILGFFNPERLPNGMDILLTSKERGIIWFSPVILLGIIGIYPLYKRKRNLCYALVGSLAAIILLYGMWWDPWGGWAFGPRYLVPAAAFLAVLLGVAMFYHGRKLWFGVFYLSLLAYSLIVNAAGVLTTSMIPPSVEIDYARFPTLTFLHNFNLLNQGRSSSFFYNTFLANVVPLKNFAIILSGIVFAVISTSYFLSVISKRKI